MATHYRIHGDNIMECEIALEVIIDSFRFSGIEVNDEPVIIDSTSFVPKFKVIANAAELIFEFLPGHGRWDTSLPEYTASLGAPLRNKGYTLF